MNKEEKTYSIGVDVGGTKMNAILFDGEKVVADYLLATPKDNIDHFIVMLKALIEPLVEKAKEMRVKIKGVGLGLPGVIDYKEKKVLGAPNLAILDGEKIAEIVEKEIEMTVKIDNDANCFVRAEARVGAGRKYHNIYGIIMGTGVGGAWYNNNEVYLGAHGGAGEPSFLIIDYNEGVRLGSAIKKLTQGNPASLAEEAYRGDVLAERSFDEIGKYIGTAMANITNLINPEVFILGGGVTESSDLFLPTAKKEMKKYIFSEEARKKVKVAKSKIGKHAGAIGAAMLIE